MENENTNPTPEKSSEESAGKPSDKKSAIYIIISLLIVLVASGAYILGGRKTSPDSSPTPTIEATESPVESELPTASASATPKTTLPPTPAATSSPTPAPTSTPTSSPIADLYVSEYTLTPATPIMNQPVSVRIGIYNQGNKAAGGFNWEWWAASGGVNCNGRIDSLAAKGGRIVTCTYTYQGWSNAYLTKVVADKDNEVAESDESNNIKTLTIQVKPTP